LKENIVNAIEIIPKEYYKNILEGAYNRKEKYVPKNKTRKTPKENVSIMGVVNIQRCKII
jgi:hypothetical protein